MSDQNTNPLTQAATLSAYMTAKCRACAEDMSGREITKSSENSCILDADGLEEVVVC
jgi:hypothetical protein